VTGPSIRLLAISMRSSHETRYEETRDAVARNWWDFLKVALPDTLPLLLPNDPSYSRDLCELPGVVGLLLTGGDDLGTFPERDAAEADAVRSVRARNLPVLGICRGCQFLSNLHGGDIAAIDPGIHRSRRHRIISLEAGCDFPGEANSYHSFSTVLPKSGILVATAAGPDGSVEAFRHATDPLLGIMWHPERESDPVPEDLALFSRVFGAGN